MRSSDVTFRKHIADIETPDPNDDDKVGMEIIEIKYPDGKVVAFPADHKSPETGVRYRDMFRAKYDAFKNGEPDPDRVADLEREIAEKQAELDALKAPDDKRVKENLGYGEIKKDEDKPTGFTQPLGSQPVKIDQPTLLGTHVTPKPELDPVLVQPIEPKTKEPA